MSLHRNCEIPFPPYSYVPGHAPHPVSDPRGHMHGAAHETPPPLNPQAPEQSPAYLYGLDLFNHGYYWEAHEAWESLWHAAGRTGPIATWLKSLIKLAAAAVKAREGNSAGVSRHAARSQELLQELRAQLPSGQQEYCGLELAAVERVGQSLAAAASSFDRPNPPLDVSQRLRFSTAASSSSPAR